MCWGSLNLGPWEITFLRFSCWMIFRSPVITCPDGLYWKGEWEQSQVRGFLRQGVNMSPFLYALYLNDVESFLGTCNLKGLESISRDIEDKFDIYLKLLIHYMLMPPFWWQNLQRNYKCFWTHLMIIAQFGNWKWMLIKLKSWFFSRGRQPQKLKFSLNGLEL